MSGPFDGDAAASCCPYEILVATSVINGQGHYWVENVRSHFLLKPAQQPHIGQRGKWKFAGDGAGALDLDFECRVCGLMCW